MAVIRLIAFDLDGTLLDDEKHLSEKNREALVRCAAMGIQLVPTTGRPIRGISQQITQIPGVRYAITSNGGAIIEMSTGKVIEAQRIPNKKALEIMKMAQEYHAMFDPYIEGRGISQRKFMEHMDEYGVPLVVQKVLRDARDIVPDIFQETERLDIDVDKVNIYMADSEALEMLRRDLSKMPDLLVTSSLGYNLEINASQANKGRALEWLAAYLEIPMEQTIAFGDGGNDLTMLQMAGIGIAMENAFSQVKQQADLIAPSNNQDGVAKMLERLIFAKPD